MLPVTVVTRDSRSSKIRKIALATCAAGGVLLCASSLSSSVQHFDWNMPATPATFEHHMPAAFDHHMPATFHHDMPTTFDHGKDHDWHMPMGMPTTFDHHVPSMEFAEAHRGDDDGGRGRDSNHDERGRGDDDGGRGRDSYDDRGDGGSASDREIAERYADHDHGGRDERGDGGGGKADDRERAARYADDADTRRTDPPVDTREAPLATVAPTENPCAKAFAEFKDCMAKAGKGKKGKAARQACKAAKRAVCK